jgi:hypothetical protein
MKLEWVVPTFISVLLYVLTSWASARQSAAQFGERMGALQTTLSGLKDMVERIEKGINDDIHDLRERVTRLEAQYFGKGDPRK